MYYCPTCRELFLSPAFIDDAEPHFWLDDCPVEHLYLPVCPECASGDLEEAPMCECCLEEFHPDDLVDGLCPECRKSMATQGDEPRGEA